MKKLSILSLVIFFAFTACNKEKDDVPLSLKGIWTVENSTIKEYINNTLDNTHIEPGNGATMDFQNNGHVVITYPGNSVESLNYEIKPDSKVEIDGDIFEIRNLTASNVTLFFREDYAPGEYDEVYINLKR
jgi:hypothetical protein